MSGAIIDGIYDESSIKVFDPGFLAALYMAAMLE